MSNNKPPKINRTRVVINFTETDVNTDKPTKPALKQNLHQKESKAHSRTFSFIYERGKLHKIH